MTPYEKYCSDMKERGLKPTMTEPQLLEAWGIKEEIEYTPYIARKSSSHRNIEPTFSNHGADKKTITPLKINLMDEPKKKFAPKISRKGWTKEQIAARKAENMRRSRENRKKV